MAAVGVGLLEVFACLDRSLVYGSGGCYRTVLCQELVGKTAAAIGVVSVFIVAYSPW